MDDHAQFLAPPPISSPLLPSSKYTSYNSLQNPYTPQSTLDSPPFYNSSSTRPSSTQYHAQAPEPYDPQSFTFDTTHVQPMHKPLSESAPPQFTASPFTPALSQSSPQHVQLGFVNLASHPHAQNHKLNAAHRTTAISPPPLTASSPSPRSAGSSHGHGSVPSRTTASTSGANTNVHGLGIGSGSGSGGGVQSAESPQNSGSGPHPPNGPGRPGTRRPMYAHGPSTRVHPSLLPPTLWMSPTNPAPGSRPGFPKIQQGLAQAQKRQPPPPLQQQQQQQQQQQNQLYGNHQQQQQQQQQSLPLSRELPLSPSSSTTTSMSLASTSLGFGATRGRRDSSVLTPVMSTIDEDEHERERKHALSIVPSSYSNFPSGLEGLGADAQNSPHYYHQPPPLSAVSGASAGMFSDLLSEADASIGPGVEEWSPEELQKEDPLSIQMWRLYARTKANLPHAQRMENLTWRMVGMALRRKQLEEQMQAQQHSHAHQQYPHEQMVHMQMKEEEQEEHKVVPVDEQADVPDRGRRLQKYGGSAAIPGSMTTTSAPTITRAKAKTRVEGFEMPDESDGYGCVFLFYFYFLRLFVWMVHVLMSWFGAQGS